MFRPTIILNISALSSLFKEDQNAKDDNTESVMDILSMYQALDIPIKKIKPNLEQSGSSAS